MQNNTVINFTQATGGWGTCTYCGIWDAVTSGNLWAFGALQNPVTVSTGLIVSFPANSLQITND